MAFTDRAEALVYSLPFLEHLHSLQLPQTSLSYVDRSPRRMFTGSKLTAYTGASRPTRPATT